jgi:hypothetical protein
MLARYYSSSLGRFTAVDPATNAVPRLPQTWNRYTYAGNNPIILRDPDGRDVEVSTEARPYVLYGLQNSASFRETFTLAQNDHNIKARIIMVENVAGAEAESKISPQEVREGRLVDGQVIDVGSHTEWVGDAHVPRDVGVEKGAELIGHELFHFNVVSIFGPAANADEKDKEEKVAKGVAKQIHQDFRRTEDDICPEGCVNIIGGTGKGTGRRTITDHVDTSDPLTGK